MELPELALDGQAASSLFDMTDNLRVNVETPGYIDHLLGVFRAEVDFQTVSHIEYFVHFRPVCSALLGNSPEKRRDGEHIVFYNLAVLAYEMKNLGLRTACAVYHTVDMGAQFVQKTLYNRGVGPGGRENQFSCIERRAAHAVRKFEFSAVNKFVGDGFVIAFRVFLRQIFGKYIVPCAGQAVAAHASVVFFLVGSLSAGGQSHDDISRSDIGIVDDIASFQTAGNGGVHHDGAYQIAQIGGLTACRIDTDSHVAHLLQQFVSTIDDGGDDLSRN